MIQHPRLLFRTPSSAVKEAINLKTNKHSIDYFNTNISLSVVWATLIVHQRKLHSYIKLVADRDVTALLFERFSYLLTCDWWLNAYSHSSVICMWSFGLRWVSICVNPRRNKSYLFCADRWRLHSREIWVLPSALLHWPRLSIQTGKLKRKKKKSEHVCREFNSSLLYLLLPQLLAHPGRQWR